MTKCSVLLPVTCVALLTIVITVVCSNCTHRTPHAIRALLSGHEQFAGLVTKILDETIQLDPKSRTFPIPDALCQAGVVHISRNERLVCFTFSTPAPDAVHWLIYCQSREFLMKDKVLNWNGSYLLYCWLGDDWHYIEEN
jgi:hypothetical protein